ncbi:MAG TPA: hypothetical protein VM165_14510 [Planctomycetaceae bacterium]|nr:hypothetical protein [Planctomycetaceae bacterium]
MLPDGVSLRDGAQISIELPTDAVDTSQAASELGSLLLEFAGTVDGLPEDMSANLNRYLHGSAS